jgi:hypothetical protein
LNHIITTPYNHPKRFKDEIEKAIKELLEMGHIHPGSSPFTSLVVMVKKKHGTMMLCIDHESLNKNTMKKRYPIPCIDDLINKMHGTVYFSKVDLPSGYHQIRVREEDIHKTTFMCHYGQYVFLVIPFGLNNTPTTFRSCMNHIFNKQLRKFLLAFFNNLLIYSRTWEENLKHVDDILTIMEEHSLFPKESKCEFGLKEILYLGNLNNVDGVKVYKDKIQTILEWPIP